MVGASSRRGAPMRQRVGEVQMVGRFTGVRRRSADWRGVRLRSCDTPVTADRQEGAGEIAGIALHREAQIVHPIGLSSVFPANRRDAAAASYGNECQCEGAGGAFGREIQIINALASSARGRGSPLVCHAMPPVRGELFLVRTNFNVPSVANRSEAGRDAPLHHAIRLRATTPRDTVHAAGSRPSARSAYPARAQSRCGR